MDIIQDEVRAEEAATIQRLGVMSGDSELSPDELRDLRDEQNKIRVVCNSERVNMTNLRATDLPHNKDVNMPGPAPISEEIQIQAVREWYVNTVRKYVNDHCDAKGVIKGSQNLTESEFKGMKQI